MQCNSQNMDVRDSLSIPALQISQSTMNQGAWEAFPGFCTAGECGRWDASPDLLTSRLVLSAALPCYFIFLLRGSEFRLKSVLFILYLCLTIFVPVTWNLPLNIFKQIHTEIPYYNDPVHPTVVQCQAPVRIAEGSVIFLLPYEASCKGLPVTSAGQKGFEVKPRTRDPGEA